MAALASFRAALSVLRPEIAACSRATHHRAQPWGADFVDQDPLDCSSARDWARVDDDELVQFHPALGASAQRSTEARETFLRMVDAAMEASARRLAMSGGHAAADVAEMLRRLDLVPVWSSWGGRSQDEPAVKVAPIQRDRTAGWIAECSALAALGQPAIATAMTTGAREQVSSVGFAAALVSSSLTGVNAAHWSPGLAIVHESLTFAAWLGILLRGRAALMPVWLAQVAQDLLTPGNPSRPDRGAAIIRALVEHTTGLERMTAAASRAAATGRPVLVTPRASATLPMAQLPPWDDGLTRDIAVRLAPYFSGPRHA